MHQQWQKNSPGAIGTMQYRDVSPSFEAFAEKKAGFYGKLKKQLEKQFSEIFVYCSFTL
jgi:hypothetical protein